jgi:hypothetical protein
MSNLFNPKTKAAAPDLRASSTSSETAPVAVKSNVPATLDTMIEMGFDPTENLKDETPDIPMIKILPQAQMFAMPDDTKLDKIEGVILETYRCNAWWDRNDVEEGNRPSCSSLDDLKPMAGASKPQSELCATCKLNQFGSAIDPSGAKTKGKECKNMRRIYILMDGHEFPYQISLSPTSLKSAKRYLTQLTDRKRNVSTVVTRITLDKKTSGSNVYSVAEFAAVKDINDIGMLAGVAKIKKQTREIVHSQAITAAEFVEDHDKEPF